VSDAPPPPPPPAYDDDNDDVVAVDGTEETTEEEKDGDNDDAAGDVELGDGTDVEDPNWTTQPPRPTSASASSGGSTVMAWYRRISTKYAPFFEDSTDGMRTLTCPPCIVVLHIGGHGPVRVRRLLSGREGIRFVPGRASGIAQYVRRPRGESEGAVLVWDGVGITKIVMM
jgi:hypothetical protein